MTGHIMGDSLEYDQAPGALILADSEIGADAARASVAANGGRVAGCLGIDEAMDRLDRQAMIQAVMLEVSRDHGPMMDGLIDRLGYVAARENVPTIVSMPIELIDTASALMGQANVTLLCQPDLADRVSSLSLAWAGKFCGVADSAMEMDSIRLRRLSDEVTRIARALSNLSSGGISAPGELFEMLQSQVNDVQIGFAAQPVDISRSALPKAADIRLMLRLRRLRDSYFDPSLFADPAWDMLLDLLAARVEGDQVAVSSLCIAAAVPPTTALRWIKAMTDHGLFERHADPMDGRRIFIRLSETATRAMSKYFAAAGRLEGVMV
jgi:DNA-binding MarR family transcriptional regulator